LDIIGAAFGWLFFSSSLMSERSHEFKMAFIEIFMPLKMLDFGNCLRSHIILADAHERVKKTYSAIIPI
jgi:hypothetical protein